MKVKIYGFDSSLKYCMYCEMAKKLCARKKIDFEFISIIRKADNQDGYELIPEIESELIKLLNKPELKGTTMPQIFADGNHIGGCDDFKKFLN